MRLSSFQSMIEEYQTYEIRFDDKCERDKILITQQFSVIFEGSFLELDSLNYWIEKNFNRKTLDWLFYGKIAYDYGFAEYFSNQESEIIELKKIIPNIFTFCPNSYSPNQISKTYGWNESIDYTKGNHESIIIKI